MKPIEYFVSVELHFELLYKASAGINQKSVWTQFVILFILFSLLVLYNLQVRFLQSNAIYTYCGGYTFRVYEKFPAG